DEGVRRVARALGQICRALGARPRVRLLLELTAGQGSCVGCSFEELAEMLQRTGERRLGVCLDTQHMWAAGIDWTTPRAYERAFARFDELIGLDHLEAFHLNDSKRPFGSRVDRHAPIGEGLIGARPFARLVRDARFAGVPGFLETPPLPSGEESFALGLSRLRALLPRRSSGAGRSARRRAGS
ncbi:MAG TPA: deoxyribonuclease IV, partial [Polyangia bacterium]